jgi:hypothetical protein
MYSNHYNRVIDSSPTTTQPHPCIRAITKFVSDRFVWPNHSNIDATSVASTLAARSISRFGASLRLANKQGPNHFAHASSARPFISSTTRVSTISQTPANKTINTGFGTSLRFATSRARTTSHLRFVFCASHRRVRHVPQLRPRPGPEALRTRLPTKSSICFRDCVPSRCSRRDAQLQIFERTQPLRGEYCGNLYRRTTTRTCRHQGEPNRRDKRRRIP